MTPAERTLLLVLAKLVQKDPNLCERLARDMPWGGRADLLRGYGSAENDIGSEILGDLIDDVEKGR